MVIAQCQTTFCLTHKSIRQFSLFFQLFFEWTDSLHVFDARISTIGQLSLSLSFLIRNVQRYWKIYFAIAFIRMSNNFNEFIHNFRIFAFQFGCFFLSHNCTCAFVRTKSVIQINKKSSDVIQRDDVYCDMIKLLHTEFWNLLEIIMIYECFEIILL